MQDNELKNGQTVPPQDEAAQQAPADAPELPDLDLSAELAKAQAKAAENYDLYVRAVAEADNTRRRASEDVAKARKFGIEKFAESMLPVVDSMEKALEASANEKGPLFDPNTMQAITMVKDPAVQPGCVATVFQRGWKIADRVLRPAMVAVAQ